VETPVAIEECLALGLEGVRGIVADSKALTIPILNFSEHSCPFPAYTP
jgi:NhaP-type Na+/H+ or K+/H+ antiporter